MDKNYPPACYSPMLRMYFFIFTAFISSICVFAVVYNRLEPGDTFLDDVLFSFNIQTLLGLENANTTIKSSGKKIAIMAQLIISWILTLLLFYIHR